MVRLECKGRGGFTLLELVIVIIVIGLLAALLLPAVSSGGRGPSRRSVCNSSMRQLALATLNFESGRNRFPGYLEGPMWDDGREFPWLVNLLPYMERNDIYDTWQAPQSKPQKPYLKVLHCTSDPPKTANEDHNSYVCNAGLIIKSPTGASLLYKDDNLTANGAFVYFVDLRRDRAPLTFIRAKDFYDGQTNTVIISESLLAGGWGDVNPVATSGNPGSNVKLTTAFCWFDTKTPTADMRINGNRQTAKKLTPELLRPSSNHPGGVNTAFADGHTQYLRETIDYRVYKQLMTPNSELSSNSEKDYVLIDADYE